MVKSGITTYRSGDTKGFLYLLEEDNITNQQTRQAQKVTNNKNSHTLDYVAQLKDIINPEGF